MKASERTRTSLELLYSISRELAAHLDLSELLARILELTLDTIGGESGSILVLDEQGEVAEGSFVYGGKFQFHSAPQLADTLDRGLAGWVVKNREAALISDTIEDYRWLKRMREVTEEQNKSAISVPFIAHNRVVGVLTLAHMTPGHFNEDDLALLTSIADQAAIAVENARLFTAEQERRKFASTLQEIAQTINSSLDPNEVFHRILEQLNRVVDYNSASIFLLEGDTLRLVASQGLVSDEVRVDFTLPNDEELLMGQVLKSTRPMLIDDVKRATGWIEVEEFPHTREIRGWIGAPLLVRDKAVGVLTVDSYTPSTYGSTEAEMVEAFAHQAATAVANAQMYAESQRQMRAMVALAETARVVSSSLDLGEVLQLILSQTMGTLEVEASSLALIDDETGDLEFTAASGEGADAMVGLRLKQGEGIAGWVVEHGQPEIVMDVKNDPRFYSAVDEQTGFNTRALACVPIRVHENIIGVLWAVNPIKGVFDPHHLEIQMGISGLAGTAIEHARLFSETRSARQRYAGLFEDSIDPILITDLEGLITDANHRAKAFLGRDSEALLGCPITAVHEPNLERKLPNWRDLDPGMEYSYEAIAGPDEELLLPIEVHVKRIDVGRQPVLQWILRDISERKALDQLRADLTSMLFHDLRSPLGNVMSSLEVMRGSLEEEDDSIIPVLSVAQRSSRRLSRLIDSLLDLNLLEDGTAALYRNKISLHTLISEAIEEVGPVAEAKEHEINFEAGEAEYPEPEIDVDMMRRVVINLLENAVKYTPTRGKIRVSLESIDSELRIGVHDTGPGIDAKDQKRIFEKFTQVKRTGRAKGLGLGLAFCRLAVEAHGGRIWVESEPEYGSTFYFTLPV